MKLRITRGLGKRHALIMAFMVFACLQPSLGWADELPVSSHVTAATIFPDRAIVTRKAKIHVIAGPHTVVISDVPAGLDESSLRVQGQAIAGVKIGTVEIKHLFLTQSANSAQRDIEAHLQEQQDARALINADIQALQSRRAFIDRIAAAGANKNDNSEHSKLDFDPEKWSKAWSLLQSGMDETLRELEAKNVADRKINEEITKLNQELGQLQTQQAKQKNDIRIQIEVASETDLQLSIDYQTGGASWSPLYDARLDTSKGDLTVEQYGDATQQTGEDWTDADLTLSTAQPSRGTDMPILSEWYVQLQQILTRRDLAASYMALADKNAQYGRLQKSKSAVPMGAAMGGSNQMDGGLAEDNSSVAATAPEPVAAVPEQAVVQSSEYAAEFRVPGHVDLKSTSDATKLFIGTVKLTATLNAQVTPQLATQAYLFAKTVYNEKFPLIPGTIAKYRDGSFIGKAPLPLVRPGETLKLAFGVDDRIKVTYRQTHEDQNNPALVVIGDMKAERQYETKIQNLHQDAFEIITLEQYPVAANPDIKVDLEDDVTTPGFSKDAENRQGVITWSATLKPQEEKIYTLGFQLKYPKNQHVIGF